MTLGELKARLKKNENEERPTITTFRTSEDKTVVQTARMEEPRIIVYENGYFLYCRDGHYEYTEKIPCHVCGGGFFVPGNR